MWVILGLLAWPLAEIALFVVIGGAIGVWATLAWVLVSAVLGVALMRFAAVRGAVRLREGLVAMQRPGAELAAGLFQMLAGGLLVVPGFLTDALGLILLIPPVQGPIARAALARAVVFTTGPGGAARRPDDVIDGDWEEVPPAERGVIGHVPRKSGPGKPGSGKSGWTQD